MSGTRQTSAPLGHTVGAEKERHYAKPATPAVHVPIIHRNDETQAYAEYLRSVASDRAGGVRRSRERRGVTRTGSRGVGLHSELRFALPEGLDQQRIAVVIEQIDGVPSLETRR